jgi:hypothetical protein
MIYDRQKNENILRDHPITIHVQFAFIQILSIHFVKEILIYQNISIFCIGSHVGWKMRVLDSFKK